MAKNLTKLVKKTVTDKNGKRRTAWVNPNAGPGVKMRKRPPTM